MRALWRPIRACIVLCLCAVLMSSYVPIASNAWAEDAFSVVVQPDKRSPGPTEEAETDDTFQIEIIREPETTPAFAGKKVLIYHTHTYEAYERPVGATYPQSEKWRTTDSDNNVVCVGKALAASLRALGMEAVHDTTAFEPPNLEDAYDRSLAMLEKRAAAGEQYDLYIDLHRDALASSSTIKRTVHIGGEDVARFMVLVGKGTTGGYTEKPDWEKNIQLAQRITDALNSQCTGLARDVKVKSGRFNQHISECCVLIECGMNTNQLSEVLSGVPYLAQAIAIALSNPE